MNLSNGSNRNSNSDTSFVDFLVDDLNFEGRVAAEDFGGWDLKTLDKSKGVYGSLEVGSEGKKNVDIFTWDTSAQWSWVYLIISGFDVVHIFRQEGEA